MCYDIVIREYQPENPNGGEILDSVYISTNMVNGMKIWEETFSNEFLEIVEAIKNNTGKEVFRIISNQINFLISHGVSYTKDFNIDHWGNLKDPEKPDYKNLEDKLDKRVYIQKEHDKMYLYTLHSFLEKALKYPRAFWSLEESFPFWLMMDAIEHEFEYTILLQTYYSLKM